MSIPWRGSEPVNDAGVDIDADVEFDAVFSSALSFDPDVVPGATVMCAEPGAVNSDVHLFSSKKPDDSVHHPTDVGDGESFHPTLNHAMTWKNRVVLSDSLTIFHVRFNTVVGVVESYLEKTPYSYGLRVMSSSSFLVGFPGWWQAANRFDHRLGETGGEVAVHMVRNCWVNPFLCASHPMKK